LEDIVALEPNTTSTNNNDQSLVTILNSLIHICHEARDGYIKAADGITSSAYKTMFAEYAHQRSRFASQLANMVIDYAGESNDDSHPMNMFSHGWQGIEPAVMGGDNGAIFAECEDSEAKAINAYEQVLEKTIPKDIAVILNQQYEQIVDAHGRLHNLLEAYHLEHKN